MVLEKCNTAHVAQHGKQGLGAPMLVVDDLGVLNTHSALSGPSSYVVGDTKGGACEDVYI